MASRGNPREDFRPEVPLIAILESPLSPPEHLSEAALAPLASSIRSTGVIVAPLICRRDRGRGCLELASGYRTYHAAKLAGMETAPVRILQLDDERFMSLLVGDIVQRRILAMRSKLNTVAMEAEVRAMLANGAKRVRG